MIDFPICKINLGLNVVARREDGYHDLETIFYPVPLCDALEIRSMDERFPSDVNCDLKITGNAVECNEQDNLVVKAYNIIAADYKLPRIHAHLYKNIPSQAGLGGGSSDAAYMIRLLDRRFKLNMGNAEMERYAAKLGADCAFFITSESAYATGIGNILQPIDADQNQLKGYFICLVKPPVAVSTGKAYAAITPRHPEINCREAVKHNIEEWKDLLTNDFEEPVFAMHPELKAIKEELYRVGAVFALMSGSGSTVFGIFRQHPGDLSPLFPGCFTTTLKLQ